MKGDRQIMLIDKETRKKLKQIKKEISQLKKQIKNLPKNQPLPSGFFVYEQEWTPDFSFTGFS